MTGRLSFPLLALALLLALSACVSRRGGGGDGTACDGDGEGSGSIGHICEADEDCSDGAYCDTDFFSGQCTDRCTASDECKFLYGDFTFCIGAELCVAECARDEDCPERTGCNEVGWCQR